MSSDDAAGETPSATTNEVPTEPHAEAETVGGEQGGPGADQTEETVDAGGVTEGGAAQTDAGKGQVEPVAAQAEEAADDGGSTKAEEAAGQPDEVQKLQQELAASLDKVKSLASLAEERQTKIQLLEMQLEEANKGSPSGDGGIASDPSKEGLNEELSAANVRIGHQDSRIKELERELALLKGETVEAKEEEESPSGEQEEGGDPGASLSEWAKEDGGAKAASKAEAESLAKKCEELEGQIAEADSAKANLQAELDRVSADLAKSEESAALASGESQKALEEVKAELATAAKLVESLETKNAESDKALVESNEAISSLKAKETELQEALSAITENLSATEEKFRAETQRVEATEAKVAAQKEELHQAELKVESSAGDALAKIAEMEVKLAETSMEAENSKQDLEVMRARGSVVESQRAELEQLHERLLSSKAQHDAFKAEIEDVKAQLKTAQDELMTEREQLESLTKRGTGRTSGRIGSKAPDPPKKPALGRAGGRSFGRAKAAAAVEEDAGEAPEAKVQEEEKKPKAEEAEKEEDVLGILPAFEANMIRMMKTTEQQVASMVERLGLRVDAASLKVQSQEEVVKDVKQSKPRLLVQIQGLAHRLQNSEERNKALRIEVATLLKRVTSYEEEANLARDRNALLDAQLHSSQSECGHIRQDALITERVTRELHRRLGCPESLEELFYRFQTASNAWDDVPPPSERIKPPNLRINTDFPSPQSPPHPSVRSPESPTRSLMDRVGFTRSRIAMQPQQQRPSTARPQVMATTSQQRYSPAPSTPPRPATARPRIPSQTSPKSQMFGTTSTVAEKFSSSSGSQWSNVMNQHVHGNHVPGTCRCVACQNKKHQSQCYDEATKDNSPHPFLRRSLTTRGSCWRMADNQHN